MAKWYYLQFGSVKHILAHEDDSIAHCGVEVLDYLPKAAGWKSDTAILAQLRKCKTCVMVEEKINEVPK